MSIDIKELHATFRESTGVSTDTRHIEQDSIFFALKGDRFDGNKFAAEAIERGARYAVIDDPKQAKGDRYILVDDVLTVLQRLARYHRDQLAIPVLAVTGSNGKTTTKELIHAVLSRKFQTYATKGNLNNHIGVPLTLLALDEQTEIAVVEMGANHVGEIALLCDIANPSHGLVTNIGKAHVGTFGGFANIVRAKSELYAYLKEHDGTAFVNRRNALLVERSAEVSRRYFYPDPEDNYHAELVAADPFVRIIAENGDELRTQLVGDYNFENIACALCVGKFFGVVSPEANDAVASYTPGNMRSQALTTATNTVILDAYNANPSSMEAALENFARMDAGKKVLILGDMFELEDQAHEEHRFIGKRIRDLGFEDVYLCGEFFKAALHEIPHAKYFPRKRELVDELTQFPVRNSAVLIKASRGIGLETVVEYL